MLLRGRGNRQTAPAPNPDVVRAQMQLPTRIAMNIPITWKYSRGAHHFTQDNMGGGWGIPREELPLLLPALQHIQSKTMGKKHASEWVLHRTVTDGKINIHPADVAGPSSGDIFIGTVGTWQLNDIGNDLQMSPSELNRFIKTLKERMPARAPLQTLAQQLLAPRGQ